MVPKYGVVAGADNVSSLLTLYFVFAYIWSMGANLHDKSVAGFDKFAREKMAALVPNFPAEGLVYVCASSPFVVTLLLLLVI